MTKTLKIGLYYNHLTQEYFRNILMRILFFLILHKLIENLKSLTFSATEYFLFDLYPRLYSSNLAHFNCGIF
jgi:hypothetical protein